MYRCRMHTVCKETQAHITECGPSAGLATSRRKRCQVQLALTAMAWRRPRWTSHA